jgi:tetratricopeptide (TPR) repeat protein
MKADRVPFPSFALRPSFFLALAIALLLSCHREGPAQHGPRLLFLGLDGADWRLLDRYIAAGVMPNLGALVKEGQRANLLTQHPPLSPLVWTTMMTGVSPLEHRILDFTRYNPVSRTIEPITSDERAVPAIWNMAAAQGKTAAVFGMWATYPPEPGVVLTDREASLHASRAASASDALANVLAETEAIHRAATAKLTGGLPDLTIVYFEGTDAIGHLLAGKDDETARKYFARIDALLGEYRELARRDGATLVIASDHGFDWDAPHPADSSTNAVTAAKWHREEGIFLAWPRAPRLPQRVAEICPLLLEMLKLPTDVREYRRGYTPPPAVAGSAGNEELAKLTALGYIGAGEALRGPAGGSTRTPGSFNNEGLILREENRKREAAEAFEGALHLDPKNAAALWNLSDLLRQSGSSSDRVRAAALLDAAIDADPHQPRWLLTRGRFALEHHDCTAALADFQHAATLMPNAAIVYTSLGTAHACLGHEREAAAAFRRSLEIEPNQPALK